MTLDPEDWNEIRRTLHLAVDQGVASLAGVRERAAWTQMPDTAKDRLREPLPLDPKPARDLLSFFDEIILPYSTGNAHPRFFGWVHGTGNAEGILGDILAAFMNCNVGGREHSAVYVERQVIAWCKEIFGFSDSGSGILTSGTSMGMLIALTVARNVKAGIDMQKAGLAALPRRLVGYASTEAHSCIAKTFDILGLGSDSLRLVPVDADFRMDANALVEQIARDRADGLQPFAVIASAGTVNTGAIDDIEKIADICKDQDLWLHVDGAFGALAVLTLQFKDRLTAISKADSLAFDFHKWLHVPYDAGCVLIKDEEAHRMSFSARREYLTTLQGGTAGGDPWYCEYGPELSRGFRALKIWFTIKAHGIRKLADMIGLNCNQARYLGGKARQAEDVELLADVATNIVCFRYAPAGFPAAELNALNREIVVAIQERGIAVPSTTTIHGKTAIRVAITNHRTRYEDLDILIDTIRAIGSESAGAKVAAIERRYSHL